MTDFTMTGAATSLERRPPDAMDRAAGLDPRGPVFALRARRPEFVAGAEASYRSVLAPAADLGLSPALRRAIACRTARIARADRLIEAYRDAGLEADLAAMAGGGTPADPLLQAIAAHVDLIARTPGQSDSASLARLQDAGLSVPQIVALSELLGYLSFQITVAQGLSLLDRTR